MKKIVFLQFVVVLFSIVFFESCSKNSSSDDSVVTGTVNDVDGNSYRTIKIGSQVWMAENLKTTHYKNGDPITPVVDISGWEDATIGGITSYNNEPSLYIPIYGRLYNWYAVKDSRGIAPQGWHIPSEAEWATLISYLGGTANAGGKMKDLSSLWLAPNTGADNSSGFSSLPGGYRHYNGNSTGVGEQAYWWSATERNEEYSYYFTMFFNYSVANENNNHKTDFMSIRCVKN